jgi:putative ABC transport system substrate-binding protein
VGLLSLRSALAEDHGPFIAAFRQGLAELGYAEGRNVVVEYRYTDGQYQRLSEIMSEFVRRPVSVIAALNSTAAGLAAKAATNDIPIVFSAGTDPVEAGLVASLNRPGGNATGIYYLTLALAEKRLGLLHELAPSANFVAALVNPQNALAAEGAKKDLPVAARSTGKKIDFFYASNNKEIDAAFETLKRSGADALLIVADPLFTSRRVQIVTLATRQGIPVVYTSRDYAEVGGLMSYGTSLIEVYRQVGIYTARVLTGAKPSDLPIVQPTKFDLVINLNTARALGITVPSTLLARADEVIE